MSSVSSSRFVSKPLSSSLVMNNNNDNDTNHHYSSSPEKEELVDEISIVLKLGGNEVVYGTDGWIIGKSPENAMRQQVHDLTNQVSCLKEEMIHVKEKVVRLTEDSNLVKFKNQLLIEMLAIASLDEERNGIKLKKGEDRCDALKIELRRVLQKALQKGISIEEGSAQV